VSLPSDHASLEQVCLHEYAHWCIARALGACGFVRLRRIVAPDGAQAGYAGSFEMHGELGEREWRVVALAGTIAEWIHDTPAIAVDDVLVRLAAGGALSPQDAGLARGYDRGDVERCTALLREHWLALLGDVAERVAEIAGPTAIAAMGPGACR
jgi:hypothetical protein